MRVLFINDDRDDIAIFCSAIVELHPDALCSSLDNPEELYYKVQEVLDGKKRQPYRLKVAAEENMPLRGFLICPVCGRVLTGSVSKGLTKKYSYYHCTRGCKCRFRTEVVNTAFENELEKYELRPELEEVCRVVVIEAWLEQTETVQTDRKVLTAKLREVEERLSYARELLITKAIDTADFRIMKSEYSTELERLTMKLADLGDDHRTIENLLKAGVSKLSSLAKAYRMANIEGKREIISSIYPEKLSFDGSAVRTNRINELVQAIYLINRKLPVTKRPDKSRDASLSGQSGWPDSN